MKLAEYLTRFRWSERAEFALKVGTTLGHLNNVAYGQRTASAALARAIADGSNREVPEWETRPADWHLIWPELVLRREEEEAKASGAVCVSRMAESSAGAQQSAMPT